MKIMLITSNGKIRCYHPCCSLDPEHIGQFKMIKQGVECYAFRMPDDIGKYTDYFYCKPCGLDLYYYIKDIIDPMIQAFK